MPQVLSRSRRSGRLSRFSAVALVGLSIALGTGCIFGAPMTPQVIEQSGTHVFEAPYDKVFAATVNALKSEGYPVASMDPAKGFIKTGQKFVRTIARGGNGTAVAVDITRQYVIHIGKTPNGVTLSAEPRIFQGNAELTDQPIWDLDSAQGERALWQRLFRDIQEAM